MKKARRGMKGQRGAGRHRLGWKGCRPPEESLGVRVWLLGWNLFSLITEDGRVWTVGGLGARPVQEALELASRVFGDSSVSDEPSVRSSKC